MTLIRTLDPQTANGIAAGEVVERPASIVKELLENALDAGASIIRLNYRQGGIQLIEVIDNGVGMDAEDAVLAFGRHATSKLRQLEDLDSLTSMGFRGEALASIAAVARVELETRRAEDETGTRVVIAAGERLAVQPCGCPAGTRVTVRELFRNVPARFKFLRKDATEAGQIVDLASRLALARPDVSFRVIGNDQEVLHTPGNNDLLSAVYAVFGRTAAQAAQEVDLAVPPMRIRGLVFRPEYGRNLRDQQNFFINGRLVRSKILTAALDDAYRTRLMKHKHAAAVLFLDLPANLIDVNVHPQKMDVRFWNDQEVFRSVYRAIQSALASHAELPPAAPDGAEQGMVDGLETRTDPKVAAEQLPVDQPSAPDPEVAAGQRHAVDTTVSSGQASSSESGPSVLRDGQTAMPRALPGDERGSDANQKQETDRETSAGAPRSAAVYDQAPWTQDEIPGLRVQDGGLRAARFVGRAFGTYLILELAGDLLLIDQHAAHERILFEGLVARGRTASKQSAVQPLIVPIPLELSSADLRSARDNADELRQLGFQVDELGPRSLALRAVPDSRGVPMNPEAAFREALAALQEIDLSSGDGLRDVFYRMACKAAIKSGDRLDEAEWRRMLDDLADLDDPYHCPHGRPVIVRMPRRELDKRFRRII